MIYLAAFTLPGRDREESIFDPRSPFYLPKTRVTARTTIYPFGVFRYRELPTLVFDDITIFCGSNGSGKSTLLNVIAEKLQLQRGSLYNRSDYFEDYTRLCEYELCEDVRGLPSDSAILTSDDIFEMMQDTRHINEGIDRRREELVREYIQTRGILPGDERLALHGLEDYDRYRRLHQMRSKSDSQSNFLRRELVKNDREQSNGESALEFFVERIKDGALYLLDEPENSLSPANQIKLKYFLEDCARRHDCQFILSTHSPFMLSLRYAKIYDLDEEPPCEKKWTELENVRTYREFFLEHESEFD